MLRAISGHLLWTQRSQIPEDNLDDLHLLRKEDGTSEIMDPQDLLGSFLLADTDLEELGLANRDISFRVLRQSGADLLFNSFKGLWFRIISVGSLE
ncbi:hypothetical protein Tco_0599498 [Tanacetum coccineum]